MGFVSPNWKRVFLATLSVMGIWISLAGVSMAQNEKSPMSPEGRAQAINPSIPAAMPADVASIDAIVAAVYDVISGPPGKKRDWDRMRSLFIPGARLIPTGPQHTGGYQSHVLTLEDYITRSSPFLEKGFFESEIARRTEQFGHIAHVFSTYESRHAANDAKPFQRGINSIQLMNDGQRWWILTIFWQGEDDKNALLEKYLKS